MQPTNQMAIVNRNLIRLLLVVTFMCFFLDFDKDVRVQGTWAEATPCEEQVSRNDGLYHQMADEPRSPVEAGLRQAPSSHRLASSRPSRLLPTHGGKPGKHPGRWSSDGSSNPFKYAQRQWCRTLLWYRTIVPSPRLYYVIALRRLLC